MTYRIGFFGTPLFARTILEFLIATPGMSVAFVVTQPDKPAGRGKLLQPSPVKELALAKDIPVLQPTSLKKDPAAILGQIDELGQIDGIVVAAYGKIIPSTLLTMYRGNWINVHASLLPRWRGAAPIHRAIMAGDATTGVCLMQMEEGLDTGAVFVSASEPILPSDCTGTLHDRLSVLGGRLCSEHLAKILSGEIIPVRQEVLPGDIRYADKIQAPECLIDWSRPASEIVCLIRGLWPWPGAFSFLGEKRLKIADAISSPMKQSHLTTRQIPGIVLPGSDGELHIQAGDGILSLRLVQLEGKRLLQIDEFLKGNPVATGVILGNVESAKPAAPSSREL